MSHSAASKKCVICAKSICYLPGRFVEDQLPVIFFLRNFLKYPLLTEDEKSSEYILETLLRNEGNPSSWISFCSCCLPSVQEAQSLYKILSELEGKLNILRRNVERTVVQTYQIKDSIENAFSRKRSRGSGTADNSSPTINIFDTVRDKIYQENVFTVSETNEPKPKQPYIQVNEINVQTEVDNNGIGLTAHNRLEDHQWQTPVLAPTSATSSPFLIPTPVTQISMDFVKGDGQDPELSVHYNDEDSLSINTIEEGEENDESISQYSDWNFPSVVHNELVVEPEPIIGQSTSVRFIDPVIHASVSTRNLNGPLVNDKRTGNDTTKTKSSQELRTCPICFIIFDKSCTMWRHFNVEHQDQIFRCQKCNKGFSREESLFRHIQRDCIMRNTHIHCGKTRAKNLPQTDFQNNSESTLNSPRQEPEVLDSGQRRNYIEDQARVALWKSNIQRASESDPILRSILTNADESQETDDDCEIIDD